MAAIRGKDTGPELIVRSGLHARGLRFRLHRRDLPGRPDLVFAGRRAVVFVHGCYWHAHDGCDYFRLPKTNRDWWRVKLEGNRARDRRDVAALGERGWRVFVVWECEIRDRSTADIAAMLDRVAAAIRG